MLETVYIFDIDSTLADNSHREHLLRDSCLVCTTPRFGDTDFCSTCLTVTDSKTTGWEEFMHPDVVIFDKPYLEAIAFVGKIRLAGARIFYLTGRDERQRAVTEAWLSNHFGRVDSEPLYMREHANRNGNRSPASVYKEKTFLTLKQEQNIGNALCMFFDDDPFVLPVYQKYGITVKCPDAWNYLNSAGTNTLAEPLMNR